MNKKLLIVDDEDAIVFALSEYFSVAGYEVDTANDLSHATTLLKRNRYALVLADLRLGDFDGCEGLDLIAQARALAPQTQSILLTAYGTSDIRLRAQQLGAAAVINKPVALSELASMVTLLTAATPCHGIS